MRIRSLAPLTPRVVRLLLLGWWQALLDIFVASETATATSFHVAFADLAWLATGVGHATAALVMPIRHWAWWGVDHRLLAYHCVGEKVMRNLKRLSHGQKVGRKRN
jgi:hypothetical protein